MTGIRDALAIPFGYILSFLYILTGNYLLSIVCMTIVFKLVMLPLSVKQQKGTAKQVRLQPKVKKIQAKYAGNQQKISEETQALYNREGFSITQGGCAPLLVQLPIMMGLYGVIYTPLTNVLRIPASVVATLKTAFMQFATSGGIEFKEHAVEISMLEHFQSFLADKSEAVVDAVKLLSQADIDNIVTFIDKFTIFGIDLTQTPNAKEPGILWLIPILSAVTSLMSALFTFLKQRKQNPDMAKNPTMGCMTFMTPLMSVYFTFLFPAGVGFYWIISNIINFVQIVVLSIVYSPEKVIAQQMVEETIKRRSKENNTKRRIGSGM